MELFSRRHKLGRPSVGLLYDTMPQGVHRALINLLSSRISRGDDSGWMSVQKATFRTPQVRQDFEYNSSPSLALLTVRPIVERCEWYTLLDICELLAALFSTQSWEESRPSLTYALFEEAVNEIFADNCLGYELSGGRVEKLGAPYVDDVVTEVRQVLQNAEYAGPNEQFEKAIGFLNQRPNPDTPNCVKDAIGAVEGLARIVTGNDNLILSKILNIEPMKSKIPGTLRQMMHKLYAYRGDAEGAGHGQTSIGQISVEEAELALGVSASCMIYLAKRFGKEP